MNVVANENKIVLTYLFLSFFLNLAKRAASSSARCLAAAACRSIAVCFSL